MKGVNNNSTIRNNSNDGGTSSKRIVKRRNLVTPIIIPYSRQAMKIKIIQNYLLYLTTAIVSYSKEKQSNINKKESMRKLIKVNKRLDENAREQHELKLNYPLSASKLNHYQNSPDNNSNSSSSNLDYHTSTNSYTTPTLSKVLESLDYGNDMIGELQQHPIHDIINSKEKNNEPQSPQPELPDQQEQRDQQEQQEQQEQELSPPTVHNQSLRELFLNASQLIDNTPASSFVTTTTSNSVNVDIEVNNTIGNANEETLTHTQNNITSTATDTTSCDEI